MAKKSSKSLSDLLSGNTLTKLFSSDNLVGTNMFTSGLSMDINKFFDDNKYLHLSRNAVMSSPTGDYLSISNEMSNKLVASAPYTIIGTIFINDGQWAIFSTDNTNCEIGIFNEHLNEYKRYINSNELGFKTSNIIKGVGRIKRYGHRTIYWDDDLNPSRYLDFDDIKWKGEWKGDPCKDFINEQDITCTYQDVNNHNDNYYRIDLDKILLSPNTKEGLSFTLNIGKGEGEIVNGTYVVFGYYSNGGAENPITNFYTLSNPQPVFAHNNTGSSLEVIVNDVDTSFEEFTLGICIFEQMNTSFYIVGTYSTSTDKIFINQINQRAGQFPYASIFKELNFPEKSAGIYRIGKNLLRIKPTQHQDFNYQPLANKIKTYWVEVEYPSDYYRKGGHNIGYMRDEVYSFFIRWVYSTGDHSNSYHIPGRALGNGEEAKKLSKGDTVYDKLYHQETSDGGRIINIGEMAFWKSEEKYDDKKPEVWGNLCGEKIRHHKMPNNNISNHFGYKNNVINSEESPMIRVLGVHFEKIQPPTQKVKNSKGEWVDEEIKDIVGYEILRGSREGNKSIIAKGIINNMRSYESRNQDGTIDKTIYYQNYPYNDTTVDKFVTSTMLQYNNTTKTINKGDRKNELKGYLKQSNGSNESPYSIGKYLHSNFVTFHSPDMTYGLDDMKSANFLSANQLKLYGTLQGTIDDLKFFEPKHTPKQKLLRAPALLASIIFGIGNAIIQTDGQQRTTVTAPTIDQGGTRSLYIAGVADGSGSSGPEGVSILQHLAQVAGATVEEGVRLSWAKIKEAIDITNKTSGIDIHTLIQNAEAASGLATGSLSGNGATITTETSTTAWKSIPGFLRKLSGIPLFLKAWGEGINSILDVVYAFGQYRNYTLQQTSHGFYDSYSNSGYLKEPINITKQSYLFSNGNIILDNDHYINNAFRPKSIAMLLDNKTSLGYPKTKVSKEERSQILYSKLQEDGIQEEDKYIASYYTALYQDLPSQYGQLRSIVQIPISFRTTKLDEDKEIFFGGDTFISRYTEKNTMFFFYDWLYGQPNGYEYDYSKYQMISHPRFWMDTTRYDVSNIIDSMANLFKTNSMGDFDPFAVNQRFSSEELQQGDETILNIETTFDLDLAVDIYIKKNITEKFYPENVVNEYDIEQIKIYYDKLNNLNSLKEELSTLEDEVERNSLEDEISTVSDELSEYKSTLENEIQTKLTNYNNIRKCGCEYYDIISFSKNANYDDEYYQKIKELQSEYNRLATSDLFEYNEENEQENDVEQKKEDIVNNIMLLTKEEVESLKNNQDDFVYRRGNTLSPINCEFFKYTGTDEKRTKDASKVYIDAILEDDQFSNIDNPKDFSKNTKVLWYDKKFNIKTSSYNKLCSLKKEQDKASLNLAIAKGFIKFLQEVVYDYDETDTYSCLCWAKSGKSDENKTAAESFSDDWEDDYDITLQDYYYQNGKKGKEEGMSNDGTGYFCGFSEGGIPYTRDPKILNPLLAYFIQEETDVLINYPTKTDFSNDWEKRFENNETLSKSTYRDYPNIYSYMKDDDDNIEKGDLVAEGVYFPVFLNNDNEKLNKAWERVLSAFETWRNVLACNEEGEDENEYVGIDVNGNLVSIAEAKKFIDESYAGEEKDLNQLIIYYQNITKQYSIDNQYTGDDRLKYWTLEGVMDILNFKNKKSIKYKNFTAYSRFVSVKQKFYDSKTTTTFYKELKCKQIQKYFDNGKGKLKRRLNSLEKKQRKANKKYNKELQKINNDYQDALGSSSDSSLLKRIRTTINSISPGSYYALDGTDFGRDAFFSKYKHNTKFGFFVKDMYMYTFVSGVRDFYVESTRNIGYRDYGEKPEDKIYIPNEFTELKELFDVDIIKEPEYVKYYKSLIPANLFFNAGFSSNINMQTLAYDPIEAAENLQRFNNRIIYSNPDADTQITDGWRVFKMNNKHDFNDEITSCLSSSEDGAIILFKNSSPIVFQNKYSIESKQSNTEISVGTGLLFDSNNLKHLQGFDSFEAGSCQDSLSAINTPVGPFYIGEDQGKIYMFEGTLPKVISASSNISKWMSRFLPYMLTRNEEVNKIVFAEKEFELTDNPVAGIGCQTSFDNIGSIVYFSKKDYKIKDEYINRMLSNPSLYPIKYNGNGYFTFKTNNGFSINVKLGDKRYFDDASFTISYDVIHKGSWVSFHDWHPYLTMSSSKNIYSTYDNGIYKHNYSANSYCNFYGKDYPFEIEFNTKSDDKVSTLRDIKYFLQTFVYSDNEYDRFHTLYDNFDQAIIYNSEQMSGLLNLVHQDESNPETIVDYPKINKDSIDVLWSKEEHVYRINQFWDITKDRMDSDYNSMFITEPNGYVRNINSNYVNYNKDEFERKKFRHVVNTVKLIKNKSGNVNFVFTYNINMNQNSIR